MSICNDNILSNNLVYLPDTVVLDSPTPQLIPSSALNSTILPDPAPSSTEHYVPFVIKKSDVSLVNDIGLIVGKIDGAVARRYVPLSLHGTGQVQIHDIISNVRTCYRDGPKKSAVNANTTLVFSLTMLVTFRKLEFIFAKGERATVKFVIIFIAKWSNLSLEILVIAIAASFPTELLYAFGPPFLTRIQANHMLDFAILMDNL